MLKKQGIGLVLAFISGIVHADNINGIPVDFVDIGYANNAADINSYGSVGYNYSISTYEIAYWQFAASGIGDGGENQWVSEAGTNAPVARVSWYEAAMYCNWLTSGNTNNGAYTIGAGGIVTGIDRAAALGIYGAVYAMPTEDEWYKAAYYNGATSNYLSYANITDSQPDMNVEARYGNSLADGPWATMNNTNRSETYIELNGTFDMMGNLLEHTETLEEGEVVYRGGGYFQSETNMLSSWRTTDVLDPDPDYITVTLRPVKIIPEPGTMSLMGLSTVGLFAMRSIRRRKRLGQSLMPVRREHLCDEFCLQHTQDIASESESVDTLTVLCTLLKEGCVQVWSYAAGLYQSFDKAFWNRMVVVHERRKARRIRLRKALRKKALDGFDAFLMLIMK